MKKMQVLILAAVMLCAFAAPGLAVYGVGDVVANFTLPDSNGNDVTLYDYMGMGIILNFWGSS